MPLLNLTQIQEGVIGHAMFMLEGQLSEMKTATGTIPAVIKDRINAPRPDFPYVVVDKTAIPRGAGDNSWLRNEEVNQDTGEVWYTQETQVQLDITCYGENSDAILNYLRSSIVDDIYRKDLNDRTGQTFVRYTDIQDKPIFIETNFIDGATMTMFITAVNEWTPKGRGSSVIEGVGTNGNYTESSLTTDLVVTN